VGPFQETTTPSTDREHSETLSTSRHQNLSSGGGPNLRPLSESALLRGVNWQVSMEMLSEYEKVTAPAQGWDRRGG